MVKEGILTLFTALALTAVIGGFIALTGGMVVITYEIARRDLPMGILLGGLVTFTVGIIAILGVAYFDE